MRSDINQIIKNGSIGKFVETYINPMQSFLYRLIKTNGQSVCHSSGQTVLLFQILHKTENHRFIQNDNNSAGVLGGVTTRRY